MDWYLHRPDWWPPGFDDLSMVTWAGNFDPKIPDHPPTTAEVTLWGALSRPQPLPQAHPRPKAVQIGCGPWDRGSIVPILREDDYDIVFLHPSQRGVDLINRTPSYTVTEVQTSASNPTQVDTVKEIQIDHYRALNLRTQGSQIIEEIATADIVTCVMDRRVWNFIAPHVGEAIIRRDREVPLLVVAYHDQNVHLTEHGGWSQPESLVRHYLYQRNVLDYANKAQFTKALVDRMVSKSSPCTGLDVKVETYLECWIYGHHLRISHPKLTSATYDYKEYRDSGLEYTWARKWGLLWTGHLIAAHCAHHLGKRYIHEALHLPQVEHTLRSALSDISKDHQRVFGNKKVFGTPKQIQDGLKQCIDQVVSRLKNPTLWNTPLDITVRTGRHNLVPNGLLCPLLRQTLAGGSTDGLYKAIKLALCYQDVAQDANSDRLAFMMRNKTPAQARHVLSNLLHCERTPSLVMLNRETSPRKDKRIEREEAIKSFNAMLEGAVAEVQAGYRQGQLQLLPAGEARAARSEPAPAAPAAGTSANRGSQGKAGGGSRGGQAGMPKASPDRGQGGSKSTTGPVQPSRQASPSRQPRSRDASLGRQGRASSSQELAERQGSPSGGRAGPPATAAAAAAAAAEAVKRPGKSRSE